MAVRFAALSTRPSGAPRRSSSTCRLVPSLPRLVGSGPVAAPPRGGRPRRAVGGLPFPPDPVLQVVPDELLAPPPLPRAVLRPLLEPPMTGRAGAKCPRHGLPLTAGPQHVQEAIQHPAVRHRPKRRFRRGIIVAHQHGPPARLPSRARAGFGIGSKSNARGRGANGGEGPMSGARDDLLASFAEEMQPLLVTVARSLVQLL